MKVRVKMLIMLISIILIPLLIIDIFSSSRYASLICSNQMGYVQTLTYNKAEYIDESLDNLVSALQQFSSNEIVRRFVTNSYEEDDAEGKDKDFISVEINRMLKKGDAVIDVIVFDNSGLILMSGSKKDVGTKLGNAEEIKEYANNNNGISRIITQTSNATNYVYIVRKIYNSSNAGVGYVCQKVSLNSIFESYQKESGERYYDDILIDSEGRALVNGSITPVVLSSDARFGIIAGLLTDFLPCYNGGHSGGTTSIDVKNTKVYAATVSTSNWGVISCYNIKDAKKIARGGYSSIRIMIIIAGVLATAGAVAISILFSTPVETINSTVYRLEHGDKETRIEIPNKDDFGVLAESINSVYDRYLDSEQRFKTALSMMDNVVFEVYLSDYTVYISDNFNQKFSFRAKDNTLTESFLYKIKVHKDDTKRFQEDVNAILTTDTDRWEGEYRLKNNYGDFSWIRIKGKKFFDSKKNPTKIIGMLVDIDREKKSAINLMQKANYDALTQLYNRATFLRTMGEEIQQSYSRRSLDALMFIDLDDFKHFNDEYGHKCGDEVLKFVADTIKEITFDKGFGGRLGGDEFVMCLTNLKLIGDAGKSAAEVISILNEGFTSESTGLHLNIHCSIGIAFFRENGGNATELLEAADAAMYRIKKSGKSNYAFAGSDTAEKTE